MNYKLVIPILVIVILAFWFYKSKSNKSSGIVDEWNEKVNSAKLTKELSCPEIWLQVKIEFRLFGLAIETWTFFLRAMLRF